MRCIGGGVLAKHKPPGMPLTLSNLAG